MFNLVLLDDNNAIRFSLKKVLLGYFANIGIDAKIYSSGDGVEGLGYVFITKPNLVIIDTTLPKYGGLEVLDYLKSNNQLKELNIPIIVLHENEKFDEYPNFKFISKHDPNFVDNFLKEIESYVIKQKDFEGDLLFKWNKALAKQIIKFSNNSDFALNKFAYSKNLFSKIFGYFISYTNQVLASIFLAILYLFAGKEEQEENVEITEKTIKTSRVRRYPAIILAIAGISFLLIQIFAVAGFGFSLLIFNQDRVEAVTRTWDGGGSTNNWSECANWSSNVCPTSADDVVFNATSTKNATIDASFTGTVLSVSINAGYTGTITQSRTLVVTNTFTQNTGTYNGGSNTLDVNGSLIILSTSNFTAPTSLSVAQGFTIANTTTFAHNSGTITFDGTTGSFNIACGSKTLNLVVFTGTLIKVVNSDCNLPLGNNPTVASAIQLSGTLTGTGTLNVTSSISNTFLINATGVLSGFTGLVTARSFSVQGATVNFGSYTTVDFNGAVSPTFEITSGTFTAPTGTMTVSGGFTISGGTFNANGGTVTFDGSTGTISCNSATFNLVTFAHSSSKTINSNCTLPLGNNPTIPASIIQNGDISGTGDLTVNGNVTYQSGTPDFTGFTSLTVTGIVSVTGGSVSWNTMTTVDINGTGTSLSLSGSGDLHAPTGTLFVKEALSFSGASTFTHHSGTVNFDKNLNGFVNIDCNSEVFNLVVFSHTAGGYTINSNCNLPLGNNPSITGGFTLNGTFSGTGTLSLLNVNAPDTLNTGFALSGFTGLFSEASLTLNGGHLNLSTYSPVDFDGSFNGFGGTFTAPSGTMTVSSPTFFSIGFSVAFNHNNGTVILDHTAGGSFSCGNQLLNLLVLSHSNTIVSVQNCVAPLGNNPISPYSLQLNSSTVTGNGTFTVNGDLDSVIGNNSIGSGFTGLVVNGDYQTSGDQNFSTFTTVDLNGDFTIIGGGSFVQAPPGNMNISGDILIPDDNNFVPNGGTVVLDGTNQTILDDINFYNLTKIVSSPDTLSFQRFTFTEIFGTFNMQGAPGNLLSLRSTFAADAANIWVSPSRVIGYLDVQDIYQQNPNLIETAGFNITDSGNNFGWDFTGIPSLSSYNVYSVSAWDSDINSIDLADGSLNSTNSITVAGETVNSAYGLSYDPFTCTLYTVLQIAGHPGRDLATIDPNTGIATLIGDTGLKIAGITFDYSGNLWAVTGDGDSSNPETLFTLDTTTATPTLMTVLGNGGSGETIGFNPNNGLLYHSSGASYDSPRVFETINPDTLAINNVPLTLFYDYPEMTSLFLIPTEGVFAFGDNNGFIGRVSPSGTAGSYIYAPNTDAVKGMASTSCSPLVPPDDPSSVGPANLLNGSAITDTTPTFTFNIVDDNTNETVSYRIEIDNNSDFSSPLVNYTSALGAQGPFSFTVGQAVGGGTYTAGSQGQTLPGGDYYWRVVAIDSIGQEGNYFIANSGNIAFSVQIIDELSISVSTTEVEVGETFNATVEALDPSNSTVTAYTGTVTFTSDSTTAIVPSNYTFTGADSGVHTFTNQFAFLETGFFTITVTDVSDPLLTSTSQTITVTEAPDDNEEENCGVNPNTVYCQQNIQISNITINKDLDPGVVEICFETNIETVAFVEYGLASGNIYTDSTSVTTEYKKAYCITITGLDENEEYIFRITTTSQAGKNSTYQSSVEVGEPSEPEPTPNPEPPLDCIGIDDNGLSFNSSQQAIINYHTIAESQCTLRYGIDEELNEILSPTALGINHSGSIDLFKGNEQDIRYSITCNFEAQEFEMCSLSGIIPASQYRNFLPQNQTGNNIFEQLILSLKEASERTLPAALIIGTTFAGAITFISDPRFITHGFAWFKLRRKPQPWGIVYDEATDLPLSFVTVRLYKFTESGSKEFVKEDISSLEGKYGFTIDSGKYWLEVIHDDFEKFEKEITIQASDSLINGDIPLTKKQLFINKLKTKLKSNLQKINSGIFIIGGIFSLTAVFFNPTPLNVFIAIVYVVNSAILMFTMQKVNSGYVFDQTSKQKVKGVFVRVFDPLEKRQLDVQISDEKGRYGFKLDSGEYLLNVYSNNYVLDEAGFPSDKIVKIGDQTFIKANVTESQPLTLQFPMKSSGNSSLNQVSSPFGS